MKMHRLGLLAAAIAAVALVGCDDDSNDSLGSVKITEDNQEAVAAAGFDLVEGSMEVDDFGPSIATGVVVAGGGAPAGGLDLAGMASTLQRHLQAVEISALTSPALPVGVSVVESGTVECETSGSYDWVNNASTWGITYDQCVEEYTEPGYTSRYEYTGSVTGQRTNVAGQYGGWNAVYDGLRTEYFQEYDQEDYVGTYTSEYELSGSFSFYNDYGGYGGSYAYNYEADDLKSSYRRKSTGDLVDGMIRKGKEYEEDGAGTVVYDEYDFMYYSYDGRAYWDGELIARDSKYGTWSVIANDFGTSYCGTVIGNLRFTGRVDDEGASTGANVLVITGSGVDTIVSYDLFKADGVTKISSTDINWFGTACEA